jgi:hypothetical protein
MLVAFVGGETEGQRSFSFIRDASPLILAFPDRWAVTIEDVAVAMDVVDALCMET